MVWIELWLTFTPSTSSSMLIFRSCVSNQLIHVWNCIGGNCTMILDRSLIIFATLSFLEPFAPKLDSDQCNSMFVKHGRHTGMTFVLGNSFSCQKPDHNHTVLSSFCSVHYVTQPYLTWLNNFFPDTYMSLFCKWGMSMYYAHASQIIDRTIIASGELAHFHLTRPCI